MFTVPVKSTEPQEVATTQLLITATAPTPHIVQVEAQVAKTRARAVKPVLLEAFKDLHCLYRSEAERTS
jgi:hypothetical protein